MPIRTRPLSANFAGLVCTGGKVGLTVPMRTLPLSLVEGLCVGYNFLCTDIFHGMSTMFSPDFLDGAAIYSGREGKLLRLEFALNPV